MLILGLLLGVLGMYVDAAVVFVRLDDGKKRFLEKKFTSINIYFKTFFFSSIKERRVRNFSLTLLEST